MNEDERRETASEIHQVIVIADDRLCDMFDFSRRGRGERSVKEIVDVLRQMYYFFRNPDSPLLDLSDKALMRRFNKNLAMLDKTD